MTLRTFLLVMLNLIAIVVCGGTGAFAGYSIAGTFELAGVVGALVATVIAMFVATFAWAIGAALIRAIVRKARFR